MYVSSQPQAVRANWDVQQPVSWINSIFRKLRPKPNSLVPPRSHPFCILQCAPRKWSRGTKVGKGQFLGWYLSCARTSTYGFLTWAALVCQDPIQAETAVVAPPCTYASRRIFHPQVIVNTLDRDFPRSNIPSLSRPFWSRLCSPFSDSLSLGLKVRIRHKLQSAIPRASPCGRPRRIRTVRSKFTDCDHLRHQSAPPQTRRGSISTYLRALGSVRGLRATTSIQISRAENR